MSQNETPTTDTSTTSTESDSNHYLEMDLLRFTTAGSVDDGKSTLIGRLLYDSKSIFEDQMDAIEETSRNAGDEQVNLALLTDGLRAEREQGITIDVAYRYFATPRRKFIIADTPGHTEYTRNMVTGASTADLAVILVDARKGVLTQSRRHAFISSLLQIPHLVVAINKMDLVDYDQDRYEEIVEQFQEFSSKLNVDDITYIPISALHGDNVVHRSEEMEWYEGSTLLYHLEHVEQTSRLNLTDFRFPVQTVIRPDQSFRGFAGQVASGTIRPDEEILVLPSGQPTRVKELVTADGALEQARAGDSVVITTTEEVDISRGSLIVKKANVPSQEQVFEAALCWMNPEAMAAGSNWILMHGTRQVQAITREVIHKIDIDSMHREQGEDLKLNEIGRVLIETAEPLYFDPYKLNNATGSFILIDPASNVTVAAGMIREASTRRASEDPARSIPEASPNVVWEPWNIAREEREERNGHRGKVLWLTGISGAGKSTIAKALERRLWEEGKQTVLLDGDQVRHGLCADLGFSAADRSENIRRVGELSRLFFEHGNIVLATFISPFKADRDRVKALFPQGRFVEVHVDVDPEVARERDPKGLYDKAERGEIQGLTGYDAPYEAPGREAIHVRTDQESLEEIVERLVREIV
ncbi:MAG: sulfate adenylyltransferase subunit CysN [Bacteroidota bacterium]